MKRPYLTQRGVFRSRYKWAKSGFLVLKFTDEEAQSLIYQYAHGCVTDEFHESVHTALDGVGYRASRSLRFRIFVTNTIHRILHR